MTRIHSNPGCPPFRGRQNVRPWRRYSISSRSTCWNCAGTIQPIGSQKNTVLRWQCFCLPGGYATRATRPNSQYANGFRLKWSSGWYGGIDRARFPSGRPKNRRWSGASTGGSRFRMSSTISCTLSESMRTPPIGRRGPSLIDENANQLRGFKYPQIIQNLVKYGARRSSIRSFHIGQS